MFLDIAQKFCARIVYKTQSGVSFFRRELLTERASKILIIENVRTIRTLKHR